jgi:opacity protein-like surface antigen
MPALRRLLLALTAGAALACPAAAGDWAVGVEVKLDRRPDDFSEPKDTKINLSLSRKLPNGIVLGGSFQPQIKTNGDVGYNLEGTLGYTWKIGEVFSVGGSAGVGEKLQWDETRGDFPYYVLRVHADLALDERWSWNMITYRFRDAFNPRDNYYTPEVSTGVSYKIDESRSVSAKYFFGWKNSDPDYQGVGIGFRHEF